MNHRHLLPNELDLLVDGDTSPGVAPLRAHLGECPECQGRLEQLREAAGSIESLPHFTPTLRFADRVMGKVQVIEPWHVALTEMLKGLVPSSTPMRFAAGAALAAVGLVVSASAVWLSFRADLAIWAFNVFLDRSRELALTGAGQVAARLLGTDGTQALAAGGAPVLLLSIGVLALVATGAVLGFRRLVATARATRG